MPVDKQKQQQEKQEHKQPSVSIPNHSIVRTLIYDVAWTKKAIERSENDNRKPVISDGFAIKMVHLKYFDPKDHKVSKVLVDYSNPEKITFPCDEVKNGVTAWCWITHNEYMNNGKLKFQRITPPAEESRLLNMYDSVFTEGLGGEGGELIDVMMQVSSGNPMFNIGLTWEDLAFVGAKAREKAEMPIFTVYRNVVFKADKADLDAKGNLKPGAKEKPNQNLTAYNKEFGNLKIGVEWLPVAVVSKIYDALTNRAALKESEKTSFKPDTFGSNYAKERDNLNKKDYWETD